MDAQDESEQFELKNGQPSAKASAPRRARTRLQNVVLGAVLGSAVALVVIVGVLIFISRALLPLMKAGDLEAAQARWNARGPANYDMDLEGNFDLKGRLRVEVRNGVVQAMTLDGRPEPQRPWAYYSVPGLFGNIRDNLRRNEASAANPENSVVQQAEFDADLGFPRRYQRSGESAGQGGDWRVVAFQRID